MPSDSDFGELYGFVLEKLPDASAAKRARMCRTFATIIGRAKYAEALLAQADDLESAERRHDQMLLEFRRKHAPSPRGYGDTSAPSPRYGDTSGGPAS